MLEIASINVKHLVYKVDHLSSAVRNALPKEVYGQQLNREILFQEQLTVFWNMLQKSYVIMENRSIMDQSKIILCFEIFQSQIMCLLHYIFC